MAIELRVPTVGESITEAMVGEWHHAEGDWIQEGDPVVEIETDKVNSDLPAPVSGRLVRILKRQGDTVAVDEVIGMMEIAAATDELPLDATPGPPTSAALAPTVRLPTPGPLDFAAAPSPPAAAPSRPAAAPSRPAAAPSRPAAAPAPPAADATRVMPAARRALATAGLDPAAVAATGPGGRLLKEDVARHVANPPRPAAPPLHVVTTPGGGRDRTERERPMSPLRRRVAERLVAAQQTAALLTTFNEADMSAVMALRKRYQEPFTTRHGVKLGLMSFFVKAVVSALDAVPALGHEVRGDRIIERDYRDIGIAVGGGKGLVVPILRDVDRLGFAEIELAIADFGQRAQAGDLKLEELQGGNFTISNGGVYGSLLSTPIVNPPQSGILGLHKIQERPVAASGAVVVRPMMYLALTYDHRIVDGREAVAFLVQVKDVIEDPTRLLLEV